MQRFTLTITLGNDAMQTGEAIAIALRRQADYIATRYSLDGIQHAKGEHIVLDHNGNTVGNWQVITSRG